MALNGTVDEPQWNSEGQFKLPSWGEPVIVASILVGAMFFTRIKDYRIFPNKGQGRYGALLTEEPDSARSSDELLQRDDFSDDDSFDSTASTKRRSKKRWCCGMLVYTPNTSRFANHFHSRIMQKFPFMMEMFYWIITYAFYRTTSVVSQAIFSKTGIWDIAQDHGLAILNFEQFSWASFLFPFAEISVQQWFMHGHQTALTILNRFYALVHIPGTVGFIAFWYYAAPSHNWFAMVRRTMTLTNLLAFTVFILYPCMPPRLLPPEYGFLDSVRHDDAQSVWMSGKYVNSLAAMPSMHFGYSFCIGSTLVWHSGIFRSKLEPGEARKNWFWKLFYLLVGIAYPASILVTIVATANHYFMDAAVATLVAIAAYFGNKVFLCLLPFEDLLLWCLRLEKPIPSTDRFRRRRG